MLGLLISARPRQWTKNILILAAPAAAGLLGHGNVIGRLCITIVAFCLLSSGGYLINDALDVDHDRAHPRKRLRPIAAGVVPRTLAFVVGTLMFLGGFALAGSMGWWVLGIAVAYVVLTVSYSMLLKHEPVVEMIILAAAFVLRAAAGAATAGITLSPWFTIVVSFGALMMVAGKRQAEASGLGSGASMTRRVLTRYPPGFLRFVWMMSATITVTGYCLWALVPTASPEIDSPWPELSVIPFVVGILRYALLIESGVGEAPEEVFLTDRVLQIAGALWVGLYLTGVYVV